MYELGPDLEDLIEIIFEEEEEDRKLFAVTEIINIGLVALPVVIEQIKKSPRELRKYFCAVLSGIGEDAVDTLLDLLEEENLRVEVADALREVGLLAVPKMIAKMDSTKNSALIKILAEIFGEIKDLRALEILKLKDVTDENARIAVQTAIKDIEEPLVKKVTDSIEATKKIDTIVDSLDN